MNRDRALTLLLGAYFGFVLSRIGFSSFDEVHGMLSLADPRMILVFGGTVVLLFIAFRVLAGRGPKEPLRGLHPGSVPGGLLFGCGWALCGVCPAGVFVALGEGQGLMLLTIAGMLLGNLAFALGQGRVFRFNPTGSCAGDGH